MDALTPFFEELKEKDLVKGHFLGFLYVLIARRIVKDDGTVVSSGLSWRDLANWLKKVR